MTSANAYRSGLLIAVTVTSLLRSRIGHRTWRAVHLAAYACWPLAIVHGLGTGTDPKAPAVLGITVVCLAAVVATAVWRLVSGRPQHRGVRLVAGASGIVAVIAATAWTASGPLKPDWAARAGTPADLLARAHQTGAAPSPSTGSDALPALPFTTRVTGSVSTSGADSGSRTVTISGNGQRPIAHQIAITGPALEGGGVQMTGSRVTFGPTSQPNRYSGAVTALNGTDIRAAVTDATGATVRLDISLAIAGQSASGTLVASSGGGE